MLLFSRYMGVSSTILKKSRWFFFSAIHIWLGPNCFSNFSLRECPLFHLPFVYFFKTSNFYSNLYLSIYVCFFKVHQLFPKHGVLLAWPKMTSPWRQYFNKIILPQSMLDSRWFTPQNGGLQEVSATGNFFVIFLFLSWSQWTGTKADR